jgi:hypothetical protein
MTVKLLIDKVNEVAATPLFLFFAETIDDDDFDTACAIDSIFFQGRLPWCSHTNVCFSIALSRQMFPQGLQHKQSHNFTSFKFSLLVLFLLTSPTSSLESFSKFKSRMGATISATQFYLYGRKNFTQ